MALTVMCMVAYADLIICWMIRYYPLIILAALFLLTIALNLYWNPLD